MAAVPARVPVQVVNVDLAVERQKILRDKLRELFKTINAKSKKIKKELVYTVNAENTELESVLRTNMEADALFTAFNYDVEATDRFKDDVVADRPIQDITIDPQLRYPVIAEFQKLVDRGEFRHRQLILVGDIHVKIVQMLKSRIPVEITVFTNGDRTEHSQPIPIQEPDRILPSKEGVKPPEGSYIVSQINSLNIAGISFSGVINMPEVNNRFILKDQTLIDTTRKLFSMEGLREVMLRENLHEEKLTFVRGKKVFMLLEPDLDHIIADRLKFDRMEQVFRYNTMEEAEHALATGKSRGIAEFFEQNGYDVVFNDLTQEERDKFLIAVLGRRLGEFLDQEVRSQKAHLALMDEEDLQNIFYSAPEPVINETLDALKKKSYQRYLALVPVKIRESVILDFLSKPKFAQAAWGGMGDDARDEILTAQAALILAQMNLAQNALFKSKFPNIKFEFDRNYDAASLKSMSPEEREATFSLFQKSLEKARIPQGVIAKQLSPPELLQTMGGYINSHSAEFYNRLNPVVRKQLWVTVGKEYKDHIDDTLHFLDKIEIIKGNKEAALDSMFGNKTFIAYLKRGDNPELTTSLFLSLKRTNKVESKNALLKKVLTDKEWKASRMEGVPKLLGDPENYPIYQKLSDKVEGLDFIFDSLICTRADYEQLKDKDPLKDATVTLIDDLIDSSLTNLFQKGFVSKDEYTQFSKSVENEIEGLRKKMAEQESEDPVGVYILESMQILNEMSNQAMSGELDKDKLEKLDSRMALRQRLIDGMKSHLKKIEEFLSKADNLVEDIDGKVTQAQKIVDMQSKAADQAYQKAKAVMGEMQKLQGIQTRALADKKRVALAQKELSLQFFDIIQPLILEKIKSLPGFIEAILGLFRAKVDLPEMKARRVIFKFTDDEIERIMRNKIVFCTADNILMQFIVTCLRIDNLEDTLFSMSNDPATLPRDLDIAFYGPGFTMEDFEGHVKERRMVAFADDVFYKRLLGNEKQKARTKATLTRAGKEIQTKKSQIDVVGKEVKAKQSKLRQIESTFNGLNEERTRLKERIEQQKERRHHFHGELDILETKFEDVDKQFEEVKQKVAQAVSGAEGDTLSLIEGGTSELSEGLRDELVKLNKEMARMMFIKGVKDSGNRISKATQTGIMAKMDQLERYPFKKRPFKKMIVADDGSVHARNIKRSFIKISSQYFKISEMSIEDVSIKRLDGRAEASSSEDYPFIVLISDRQEDRYSELRRIVRKIRNRMPETYQLVFTPMGAIWKLDGNSEEFKNIRSLKENSALINSAIADYSSPPNIVRLLHDKAPLN